MKSFQQGPPDISIIVPVLYEGTIICQLLNHLAESSEMISHEIIVVDGDARGSTVSLISSSASHIKTLVAAPGRGSQMNAGAKQAQGKILLFLHADTRLPSQALTKIWLLLKNPEYGGGAFDLEIDSPQRILKLIGKIASWRSRLTRLPYGDQAIFLRRDCFHAIGRYPEIPIMEDVTLMRQLKQSGDKIYIFRDRILVSPRRWQKEGVLYCTLRNWLLLLLYYIGVSPDQLVVWYCPASITHKRRE
jgi:rSAM/selenodomain-associated transferase 2